MEPHGRDAITRVHARQILDSRGRPTVEVEVTVAGGVTSRASVPSGASTGSHEAHELRDGDPTAFNGLGVLSAVEHVNGEIAAALRGRDVTDQAGCDSLLRELDGTPGLSRLGANAVLGTSLAVCRAAATNERRPLYRRIEQLTPDARAALPVPMVNILSGGLHAGMGMDVQDLLAIPLSATTMFEAIELVSRVRDAAAAVCADRGIPTLLADEGGLSPGCRTGRDALELMVTAIERAGLEPGREIGIAIDVAATSLHDSSTGTYRLDREGRRVTSEQMIELITSWVSDFPIVSIEDPLDEDDWSGWHEITSALGDRIRLIGDDLFTTNAERLRRGVTDGCANGVLVKLNQNGTLTGTLEVVSAARAAAYAPVISARSGETEDDLLADLAVGTGAGQIKVGSVRSSERLAKYNQLLRIAEDPELRLAPYVRPGVPSAERSA
jgi:enolase